VTDATLDVEFFGRHAGVLQRKENGNLRFLYDPAYVESEGPPLSINLPVRREAYPHRDCLAFFGNLLPEEDVRKQIALATGISAANDYKLLARLGGDVAGAVTLAPASANGEAKAAGHLEELSPDALDEILTALPQRPLAADEEGEVRMSLAGAQSKLPVVELPNGAFALPHGSDLPTTHIIKPEPENLPGLVNNELFCMHLAAEVGLSAAGARRARTRSGLPILVVTRYDRDLTQEPIRRLHQEDLCQALGKLHIEKYQQEGGPTFAEAMNLINSESAVPARDRQALWLGLVFNVLIGNCDAHGKNYSLLYDSEAPSLAPFYDLVSTAVYPELTTRLAMSVDGAVRLEEVDLTAFAKLADEVGFAPRFLEQRMLPFVEDVESAAEQFWLEGANVDSTVTQIFEEMRVRAKRLLP